MGRLARPPHPEPIGIVIADAVSPHTESEFLALIQSAD